MEAISLKNPYPNGVNECDENLLQPFLDILNEIRDKILDGEKVYIRITSGERKGSIAYIVKLDPDYNNMPPILRTSNYFRDSTVRINSANLNVILGWEGRRNRIKWSTHTSTEYLRGYTGPTVWEKFDKKATEEKYLEDNPIFDRSGNALSKGDRVLYINARYGCAARLDCGVVKDLKYGIMKTSYNDGEAVTPHVIIKNDDGSDSDIKRPSLSILKWKGNI